MSEDGTGRILRVAEPVLEAAAIEAALDALRRAAISGHVQDYIERFEHRFAAYCGVAHGVACCNGTAAVHLALAALGIGRGDEVLVPAYTNMAPIFAVLYQGAVPVAVDIDRETWNLDPARLEPAITPRTRAIVVVHAFGHPADMAPILAIARRHGLRVVEDAAEAHGALYDGRKVGSFADVAAFSFYANKIVAAGEGGMVLTEDGRLAERVRRLRNLCYGGGEDRFQHDDVGFNYRMSNLHAAIGWAQSEHIERNVLKKRQIAAWYGERLGGLRELQLPVERANVRNVYWMYQVVPTDSCPLERTAIMRRLAAEGIETRPGFVPFDRQGFAQARGLARPGDCPIAGRLGTRAFYLPSGLGLAEEDADRVARSLRAALRP